MTKELLSTHISESHFSDMKLSILGTPDIYIQDIMNVMKEVAHKYLTSEDAQRITVKGDSNFVTAVDMNIESAMKERLSSLCPKIQFMGEERDNSDIDFSRPFWILDPVDGTTNLIHDLQTSAISLGLAADSELVAGIVFNPYRDELYFATKGGGAFCNGKPVHVTGAASLSESLIATGTSPYYHEHVDDIFRIIKNIYLHSQDVRRMGSAVIEMTYVASGRLDGFFELILKPWDFAAGIVIVTEAGGKVTDHLGNKVRPDKASSVVATNGLIHEELLALMGE